jgi:hypothetical protein
MSAPSRSPRHTSRFAATALLAAALLSNHAMAALGRAPQPRPNDATDGTPVARQLRASPSNASNAPYTVSTIVEPTGTVVQEFVNAQQQVFAVVWQGPVLPDLVVYFGEHHSAFQQAVQQKRATGQRGGAVMARQADLVMMSHGRMGRFQGHAYIPSLAPQGLNIQTLLP